MDGLIKIPAQPGSIVATSPQAKSSPTSGSDFQKTLAEAVDNVNRLQAQADKATQALASGRTDNIADVMLAVEKADIALRMMMQVRNKILEAYQEMMKMQV